MVDDLALASKLGAQSSYTRRMDNLTHTLIGALVGEAVARAIPRAPTDLPELTRRNLCVTLAAVGSNLPDSDLLYSFFGGKVNYLLHHRGHTHTILIALLLGAAVFALTRWWLRRRNLQASSADRRLLAGVLLLTPLLHIAMDFGNNYGVHPFWPLDNRWFYGDSIFIIEPLFWAACAPLAFVFRTRPGRFIVWMVMVLAICLVFFTGMVPRPIAAIYSLLVVAMLLIGWRAPPGVALTAGVGLWLGTTLMFVLAAQSAKSRIEEIVAHQFTDSELVDHVVTPMPSNPFCWEIMLVQKEADTTVLRRAMFARAPSLFAADQCLTRSLDIPVTAPLAKVPRENTAELKWYGQIASPLEQLRSVAKTNCEAAAALRFIRVPWLATVENELVLGDLRYDREAELGFSEIAITDQPSCPVVVPQWTPPRLDLLTNDGRERVTSAWP
jgi:inner membrane protein